MEKIMIYPYSKRYEPYVRHQELMEDVISSLVSPRGWGMEGEKVSFSDGELVVEIDFTSQLLFCTAVWFVDDAQYTLSDKVIWEKLKIAIENGKKILFTRKDGQILCEDIYKLIPHGLNISDKYKMSIQNIVMPNRWLTIDTPVVAVCGLEENTDKFEVQMALRKKFIQKDYLVSSISSRNDSEIYGLHSMPKFMFQSAMGETDKIIKYNHYVKNIEMTENPELIIIGIPGGLFPFDKLNHNNFGILAYEISSAVPMDIAIMCMPYNSNFGGDYSVLKHDVKCKFDFEIEYCHVAARVIDVQTLLDDGERSFLTIDRQVVANKLKALNKSDVIDLKDDKNLDIVVDGIIKKLS